MRGEAREARKGNSIKGKASLSNRSLTGIKCDRLPNLSGTPSERTYQGLILRAVFPGRGIKIIYLTASILYLFIIRALFFSTSMQLMCGGPAWFCCFLHFSVPKLTSRKQKFEQWNGSYQGLWGQSSQQGLARVDNCFKAPETENS